MVHEYFRSPVVLAEAVNAAHEQVPMLVAFAQACHRYAEARRLSRAVGGRHSGCPATLNAVLPAPLLDAVH
jgi:hypothetical protein